ncbi:MAG: ABC transporter ATP-binding protein [Candidatus Omnitrophica bacterium]|nr:ABC transporter ATP-binding protein [Candidatus Omnitrophota bacterium]
MENTVIRLKEVVKIYDGEYKVAAVNGISMSVERGSFSCIAGPSGSGKTSLLNLMGGLDKPTSGDVFIEDKNIAKFSRTKLSDFRLKKLGFVFQELNLIPVLTIRENIEFPLLLQGWDETRKKKAVNDIIEELGLEKLSERRPLSISGGQQQRAAVARAIVSNPAVILADEPTANLDSGNARSLIGLMNRLNREKGITFVLSSHDEMVLKEAGSIIYLRDGKIIQGA